MFYFLWHENRNPVREGELGPFDVSKIFAQDPDAQKHINSPLWGPIGMFHYWGEPLYGYYLAEDPWVLRRHAQLLSAAGVDTLIFDATNTIWYPQVTKALCEAFREVRKAGGRTPQLAFMVNTEARHTARRFFEHFYKPGLYRELWFSWNGKPLLICDPAAADDELRAVLHAPARPTGHLRWSTRTTPGTGKRPTRSPMDTRTTRPRPSR